MDLGISGRTALVLAAGGGLGSAIAATLAREGTKVAIADVSATALAAAAAQLGGMGAAYHSVQWDLGDLALVDERIRTVEEALGPIDILINITGGPPPSPVTGHGVSVWREQFDAIVLSVIAITDRVLPSMKARNWGRIVTSSSSGALSPIPNLGLSNTLRIALSGWSKTLAREVAPHNITSNIVIPGRIATPRIQFLDEQKAKREGREIEKVAAESHASIPMGRYGEPQEYADAVAFLASERASYITGSVVRVDGGMIAGI